MATTRSTPRWSIVSTSRPITKTIFRTDRQTTRPIFTTKKITTPVKKYVPPCEEVNDAVFIGAYKKLDFKNFLN